MRDQTKQLVKIVGSRDLPGAGIANYCTEANDDPWEDIALLIDNLLGLKLGLFVGTEPACGRGHGFFQQRSWFASGDIRTADMEEHFQAFAALGQGGNITGSHDIHLSGKVERRIQAGGSGAVHNGFDRAAQPGVHLTRESELGLRDVANDKMGVRGGRLLGDSTNQGVDGLFWILRDETLQQQASHQTGCPGKKDCGSGETQSLDPSIAPPQLEPAPAVQPKQWLPVVMGLPSKERKSSISQMVRGRPGMPNSSI